MIALIVLEVAALGYEWDSVYAPSGTGMYVWFCDAAGFTSPQDDELEDALYSWNSGTGSVIQGAVWHYTRNTPDRTSCGLNNGYNEVGQQTDTWFDNHSIPSTSIAVTITQSSGETDVIFRDSVDWTIQKPSQTDEENEYSLGQTAFHEFGHGVGFEHDNTTGPIAAMNSKYPFGGDVSAEYRPHEDDYVGLVTERPHSSSGVNLMLGRFLPDPTEDGNSYEKWDFKDSLWTVCDTEIDPATDGPEGIYAIVYETTGAQNPEVRWNLSADSTCWSGTEYTVGTRFPGLSSNTPYLIQPNSYDFSSVPAGDYYLCAMIDPDDDIAETSESDNNLRSEVLVTVQDCP